MGRHQYRRSTSHRPRAWLLANKLAARRGMSVSALIEGLVSDNAALWRVTVSDEEVEAFKAQCRASSPTEVERKENARAWLVERMRKAAFG